MGVERGLGRVVKDYCWAWARKGLITGVMSEGAEVQSIAVVLVKLGILEKKRRLGARCVHLFRKKSGHFREFADGGRMKKLQVS